MLSLIRFFVTLVTSALAFLCGVLCLVIAPTPIEPIVNITGYVFIALSCAIASLGVVQVIQEH